MDSYHIIVDTTATGINSARECEALVGYYRMENPQQLNPKSCFPEWWRRGQVPY